MDAKFRDPGSNGSVVRMLKALFVGTLEETKNKKQKTNLVKIKRHFALPSP